METKTYLFKPDKALKQGYTMTDENGNVVYEAIMTKFTLILPFKFQFVNRLTGATAEHKVGHTVTLEQDGFVGWLATKSYFKYDGKKIWDYLHEEGIRVDSNLSSGRIGMTYTVTLKGKEIATFTMSNPAKKKAILLVSDYCYDVTTTEEYLDLAFLCAFAFARTNQTFYN